MQDTIALPLTLLLCAAILFAGCTGSPGPAGTSSPPTGTASGSAPAGGSLTTSPTDAMPANIAETLTVQEKVYDGTIPVIFNGGMEQNLIAAINVTLYRADGQIVTRTIGTKKGDEVILQGTKQTDRVVVYMTMMNGVTYKVADVLSPYTVH
ncbi:MAG: hypothetical protein ABSB80_12005 [Methanoregula sp.]|jgi:hypothetical protein|uniref:hypothetical protein n=1 Tax=Methanoregula sp. TaxID=2052170 RepID=UPI003D0DD21E